MLDETVLILLWYAQAHALGKPLCCVLLCLCLCLCRYVSVPACLSHSALNSNLSPKQNTCPCWKSIKLMWVYLILWHALWYALCYILVVCNEYIPVCGSMYSIPTGMCWIYTSLYRYVLCLLHYNMCNTDLIHTTILWYIPQYMPNTFDTYSSASLGDWNR